MGIEKQKHKPLRWNGPLTLKEQANKLRNTMATPVLLEAEHSSETHRKDLCGYSALSTNSLLCIIRLVQN